MGAPSGGAPSTPQASSSDSLMDGQRRQNKLLVALREDAALRGLLLRAAAETQASVSSPDDDVVLYVLLPQSVTLDDVAITQELVETHLVHMRRPSGRSSGEARPFTSLNGLCGTCLADGSITVHGRLRRAADQDRALGNSVGGWAMNKGRAGTVPQLESQIVVLREATLPPSAKLPLRVPVGLLLISDPLFFPGCGWKLPLALRRCTHRFADVDLKQLPLADLPQLLFEYQILARAWMEETDPTEPLGVDESASPSQAISSPAGAAGGSAARDAAQRGAAVYTTPPGPSCPSHPSHGGRDVGGGGGNGGGDGGGSSDARGARGGVLGLGSLNGYAEQLTHGGGGVVDLMKERWRMSEWRAAASSFAPEPLARSRSTDGEVGGGGGANGPDKEPQHACSGGDADAGDGNGPPKPSKSASALLRSLLDTTGIGDSLGLGGLTSDRFEPLNEVAAGLAAGLASSPASSRAPKSPSLARSAAPPATDSAADAAAPPLPPNVTDAAADADAVAAARAAALEKANAVLLRAGAVLQDRGGMAAAAAAAAVPSSQPTQGGAAGASGAPNGYTNGVAAGRASPPLLAVDAAADPLRAPDDASDEELMLKDEEAEFFGTPAPALPPPAMVPPQQATAEEAQKQMAREQMAQEEKAREPSPILSGSSAALFDLS